MTETKVPEVKPEVSIIKKFKKTKMALNGILGLASFATIIVQILTFIKDLNNHLQIVSNLANVEMEQVEVENLNLVADQKRLDTIVTIALVLGFLSALSKFVLMFLSGDIKYGTQIKIFLGLSFVINLLNILLIVFSKKQEEKTQEEKTAYMTTKFIFTLLSVAASFFTLYHKCFNGDGEGLNWIGSTNFKIFGIIKKMIKTKPALVIGGGIGFISLTVLTVILILMKH
mgnify:FL=1